jgi:quercetin dioxygenase-like cupin family protein
MKVFKEKDMVRGWFVGNFFPTVYNIKDCEVGLKRYKVGDYEPFHYHKIALEITIIVYGSVEMNSKKYAEGDIIVIDPGEGTDFRALTDVANVVVKIPSVVGDKYVIDRS